MPFLASPAALPAGVFDQVAGLPLHPLMVHAAVVLLPLAALGVIALVARPAWRAAFTPLVAVLLLIGAVCTYVAKESGEALEKHVGDPGEHAEWGDRLTGGTLALLLVAGVWLAVTWRHHRALRAGGHAHGPSTAAARGTGTSGATAPDASAAPAPTAPAWLAPLGWLAAALSLAVLALTVVTGHSGAVATWNYVFNH